MMVRGVGRVRYSFFEFAVIMGTNIGIFCWARGQCLGAVFRVGCVRRVS